MELRGNTAPIATVTDATLITPSANAAQPMWVHAEDGSPVQKQIASLVELQSTPNMAELQRQTPDLANIICYLQTGQLPHDKQLAKRIVCDADNWYLDGNAVLYHLHNPSRRNVNSVRPLLTKIAVPHTFHTWTI